MQTFLTPNKFGKKEILNYFLGFAVVLMLCCSHLNAMSHDMLDARIHIGLKLFRATLASDTRIKNKVNADEQLPLLLIYKNNKDKNHHYRQSLISSSRNNQPIRVKGLNILVESISIENFISVQLKQQATHPGGVFLLDQFSNSELKQISDYGIKYQLITFSPYEGDVEKGISAGISIGTRVRPYINLPLLKQSNIQIKSLFLQVAKKYAE